MLYCALGASHAGLLRKETRGFNMRTDFPYTDNSTGLYNTVVSLDKSGGWSAEKADKFDGIVPTQVIATMVPQNISLNTVSPMHRTELKEITQ